MMRPTVLPLLLTVCALGAGLTACQGAPAEQSDAKPVNPYPIARPAGGARGAALIGDTVDLGGRASGEHLRLSLTAYVDPAVPVPGKGTAVSRPPEGMRRVGVRVALLNVGGGPYDASGTETWVADTTGKRHPAVSGGEITTGMPVKWNILAAGESADGWLLFDVPESAVVTQFHGDLGKSAVEWRLRTPPSR
ncbi:DUF4352 domain-containing protein [Streptomyces qinzhouensis]|uniref:DUF4352 domain-containing protein n=1 Tax=Streptomyces qinzhouensis TaxID=2599401 RepID=A0A5B8IJU3_9ACTN|nr:DUF4352 domain-containing protein [Streptomyces qinzhouensis]QDY78752.1 DUF4352 domain-containing protein [Streptomyces qinzhouensis]